MKRKIKIKSNKRKQRLEIRKTVSWKADNRFRINKSRVRATKVLESLPVVKSFNFTKRTQDWNKNCRSNTLYINNTIQSVCEYLKDLFGIDHEVLLTLRPNKNNNSGSTGLYPEQCFVEVGCSSGLRATTLVHEFLHAAGHNHEYEINGYSDFRSNCVLDTYSPLIVKDIFGRKEILLL